MNVEYVDHFGNDLMVVNTARVSFDKFHEVYKPGADDRLIEFLAREGHWSPFAHPRIQLRCSAPVPIQTQAFKHKIGFDENGESRRYVDHEPEVFFPQYWRKRNADKKQGSLDEPVDNNYDVAKRYEVLVAKALEDYNFAIKSGVAPEQARFFLPQGTELKWIWTGSLYGFSRFYNLRSAKDAQKEIRDMAESVSKIIQPLFPASWYALTGVSE